MRLSGSKRKGKHVLNSASKKTEIGAAEKTENDIKRKRKLPRHFWRYVLIGIGSLVALTLVVGFLDVKYGWFGIFNERPPVNETTKSDDAVYTPPVVVVEGPESSGTFDGLPGGRPLKPVKPTVRDKSKITFLVLGTDSFANTDVIMAVTFDTANYTFNVVSIPRDTLVNVKWSPKRANSIVYNMRREFKDQDNAEAKVMKATKEIFADLLGFEVDYYVSVNMRGFTSLIDAIGGVDFYVPRSMDYDDPSQNLHIHYSKGMHTGLSGQKVLEIIRFRKGYASQDIGRIETQQELLKATAEQILAKRSSIKLDTMADLFLNYVDTDLQLKYIVWLGQEFFKMDAENVHFAVMPGNGQAYVEGGSYYAIYIDQWLEVVNTMLNPFSEKMTMDDISVISFGDDRRIFVTDGKWKMESTSWGSANRSPSSWEGTSSGLTGMGVTNSTGSNQGGSQDTKPPSSSGNSSSSAPSSNPSPAPSGEPPSIGESPASTSTGTDPPSIGDPITAADPSSSGDTQGNEPSDASPADGGPADVSPSDGGPADGQTTDAPPTDGEPSDTPPTDGQPTDTQPTDGEPSDSQPPEGQPSEGQPAENTPAEGQTDDGPSESDYRQQPESPPEDQLP